MVQIKSENPNTPEHASYEIIGPKELARRWDVPVSWVYEHTRARSADPIPTVPLGKYKKFAWGSPKLEAWWQRQAAREPQPRRVTISKQQNEGEFKRKERR